MLTYSITYNIFIIYIYIPLLEALDIIGNI